MPTSEEMYERGSEDAQRDELNSFYYQHYYHYRKGYDKARLQVKRQTSSYNPFAGRPILALILGLLVGGGILAFFAFGPGASSPDDTASSAALQTSQAATPLPSPTREPTAVPSPTLVPPTPTPLILAPGGRAQVINVGEAGLLARQAPAANAPVQFPLPEGSQIVILEGPIEADGFVWWLIQNESAQGGWSAESSSAGVVWLEPIAPDTPPDPDQTTPPSPDNSE